MAHLAALRYLLVWRRRSAPTVQRNFGSTFVEVVLVIVFLAVALLAGLRLMSSSLSRSFRTELLVIAADLANQRMETILADKNSKGYGYIAQKNYTTETNIDGHPGFSRSVRISDLASSKRVEVRVTHDDLDDFVLVAFLTNY